MPDLDQIKQGEQGARDRGGRFAKGRSGNPPAGRAAAASGITCARRTGKGIDCGRELSGPMPASPKPIQKVGSILLTKSCTIVRLSDDGRLSGSSTTELVSAGRWAAGSSQSARSA